MRVIKKRLKKKGKNGFHVHFTYSAITRIWALGRRLSNHNVFWKQMILKFFCKRTNNVHEFEGCFPRGQVSSNGFKVFNGGLQSWTLNFIAFMLVSQTSAMRIEEHFFSLVKISFVPISYAYKL